MTHVVIIKIKKTVKDIYKCSMRTKSEQHISEVKSQKKENYISNVLSFAWKREESVLQLHYKILLSIFFPVK